MIAALAILAFIAAIVAIIAVCLAAVALSLAMTTSETVTILIQRLTGASRDD